MAVSSSQSDRQAVFQRQLGRMLLCFVAVALIDVLVVSLFSGKLRCWFPAWIDPRWQSNPRSPVVYSQSYMAGILFIPLLARAVERAFLAGRALALRLTYYGAAAAIFVFVLWWKGGLMMRHHKQREAVAWVVLTTLLWLVVRFAPAVERRLGAVQPERLLAALLGVLGAFFLVMAVLDPLMQLGVHGQPIARGLVIEVVFFVPAAVACWFFRRRLLVASAPGGPTAHRPPPPMVTGAGDRPR